MKHARLIYLTILIGAVVWCSAFVLAPVLITSSGTPKECGKFLYAFFHLICHQLGERSFFIHGMPLGVCSRCSAIYFGFLFGTLIYPAVRSIGKPEVPSRWILGLLSLPMIVDAFAWLFGLYEATIASRAISGSIAGLALAFFIVPSAIQAIAEIVANPLTVFHPRKGIFNVTETR
jgi:uncharacterized membrane protein